MKKLILTLMSAFFVLASSQAYASDVTLPNTFTAGTPARAAEVNGNFTAVKTAVDDNNARLTAVEANKQNRVTGTCAAGGSIRTINADGSVVCQIDTNAGGDITSVGAGPGLDGGGTTGAVTVKLASGAVSVSSTALSPSIPVTQIVVGGVTFTATCLASKLGIFYFYEAFSTNSNCNSVAPVQLPDGATLTGLSCGLYDNDTTGGWSRVDLFRVSHSLATQGLIFRTPATADYTNIQTVTDITLENPAYAVVDNANHSYYMQWYTASHDTTAVGSNARFYNCVINFTY